MAITNAILRKLSLMYQNLKNGNEAWQVEREKVGEIIEKIRSATKSEFALEDGINVGGISIVLKVRDMNLGVLRALKFPRPLGGKEKLLAHVIESEISRLIESAHENIVAIYRKGEVNYDRQKWPFYVMEYIDGAVDAKKFLVKWNRKFTTPVKRYDAFVKVLQQVVEGLRFVHSRGTLHCDVKLENILVAPDGKAKLSDFGSAKLLDPASRDTTDFIVTKQYAHPILLKLAHESTESDPNRMQGKILRKYLKLEFDLYALGKNILRVLHDDSKPKEGFDTTYILPYEREYLALMACRMLDGYNISDNERSLGDLPAKAYEEIKYEYDKDPEAVARDIKKITGEYAIHQRIKELDHHFPETIQISSPGAASFPLRVGNMLKTPFFRRLAGVSQLGLIVQIYPSANHSRLEHVLGTFANVARYCDALWNDPINPLFRQIMTEHDVNVILLAALCHDIGQYALAHDFEGAERKIFSHREVAKDLLTSNFNESKALRTRMKTEWGVELEEIIELLECKLTDHKKPLKLRLLHSLIDGPIDADKLDYLIRDSNHLNVPYGRSIDFERLLRCLTVILNRQTAGCTFISLGIHEKGKVPAESVAFARYAMFGSVYWHHTSRSAKCMLHRAVWEALSKESTNKNGEITLRNSLLTEIRRQLYAESNTLNDKTLFPDKLVLAEVPQLTLGDYQMLQWIGKVTSKSGQQLLKMICERNLFKRLKVLSYRRESDLWEMITALRKDCTWKDLLKLQAAVQRILVESVTMFATKKATDRKKVTEFKRLAEAGEVLFLVDIPAEREGTSVDLFFLPERRMHGPISFAVKNPTMEDSVIWRNLAINFSRSVGKIRVFCHPQIIEVCTECLIDTDEVEGALRLACQEVSGR